MTKDIGRSPDGSGCQPAASSAEGASSLSGIPSAALVGLLRALAHDCEATDGFEDAATTVHAAADRLLEIETRMMGLHEWATAFATPDNMDDAGEWDQGWEVGYSAASRMVAIMVRPEFAPASATEAGTAATVKQGAVHESATTATSGGDAQGPSA